MSFLKKIWNKFIGEGERKQSWDKEAEDLHNKHSEEASTLKPTELKKKTWFLKKKW
jgi:hypothetical protein